MSKAKEKDLIIVESFAKTKTLSQFLGPGYEVKASLGHVRDLPKNKLGVDPASGFTPTYVPITDRADVISDLKKAAKNSRHVYLASDPDREGEAIAWHLSEVLGLENPKRIEFNEITKTAVLGALANPRTISLERVNAQQTRRVLDRLVGYQISPLLWKKVAKNLSAGRVQSVAVRLVVEREREIQGFVTNEYWSLGARLTPTDREFPFEAKLAQVAGKKPDLSRRENSEQILERLGYGLEPVRDEKGDEKWQAVYLGAPAAGDPAWRVTDVRRKEQSRNPAPPFITSTVQQEAARKLGFNARRTMTTAQQLYEGIDLHDQGHVGLITYMRTDSANIAAEAQHEAQDYVSKTYGSQFLPPAPRKYKSKKGAQEAHEAIRPTSVFRTPEQMRQHLTNDQFRLYDLIWKRFLASQMAAAVFDVTSVDIEVLDLLFRATGRVVKFAGFTVLYTEGKDDRSSQEQEEDDEEGRTLPSLSPQQILRLLGLLPGQHFTEPPARYTEATLVRTLEDKGIGRPSTYAAIMSTIVDREYVVLEDKRFRPTDLGCQVNDQLVRHFPEILNEDFTARVEQQLDDIADGERDWVDVLQKFYDPFQEALSRAETDMERQKAEETDVSCPLCGKPMVLRSSRYGKFLGCSGYPECRHTIQNVPANGQRDLTRAVGEEKAVSSMSIYMGTPAGVVKAHARLGVLAAIAAQQARGEGEPTAGEAAADAPETQNCPNCGLEMALKKGRFGEFWGCTGYPECKTIIDPKKKDLPPPDPDFSIPCPRDCGGTVTAKRSMRGKIFYGCSNYNGKPKCEYVAWNRPLTDKPCEVCGFPQFEDVYRGQSKGLKCSNSDCSTNAGSEKKAKTGAASRSSRSTASKSAKTATKSTSRTTKAAPKTKTAAAAKPAATKAAATKKAPAKAATKATAGKGGTAVAASPFVDEE